MHVAAQQEHLIRLIVILQPFRRLHPRIVGKTTRCAAGECECVDSNKDGDGHAKAALEPVGRHHPVRHPQGRRQHTDHLQRKRVPKRFKGPAPDNAEKQDGKRRNDGVFFFPSRHRPNRAGRGAQVQRHAQTERPGGRQFINIPPVLRPDRRHTESAMVSMHVGVLVGHRRQQLLEMKEAEWGHHETGRQRRQTQQTQSARGVGDTFPAHDQGRDGRNRDQRRRVLAADGQPQDQPRE